MESVLGETAKQVPALVVLLVLCISFARAGAVVVRAFLTQLTETRADYLNQNNTARGEYLKAIERFHGDNMEARSLSTSTIHENTIAAENQSKAIQELTIEVRELRNALLPVIRKLSDKTH